jgi:sugar O-acyltransferase (sialic acid O-acetyltransferase NeuD family)
MTVALVGGGGHALVVASVLACLADARLAGYTDLEDRGPIEGAAWLGPDSALAPLRARGGQVELALGIGHLGDTRVRSRVIEQLTRDGFVFRPVVSARASVASTAGVAKGAVVMAGAVINARASVGAYAIVNTSAVIEHGTTIGEQVHVAPGAIVCGDCRIGASCLIGAGAVVAQGVEIPADCLIGAGAVVTKSLLQSGTYIGCPARRMT